MCSANRIASCLFTVDKPPIDELHSLPEKVRLNAVSDVPGFPCAGEPCDIPTTVEVQGDKSYNRMTMHYTQCILVNFWVHKIWTDDEINRGLYKTTFFQRGELIYANLFEAFMYIPSLAECE